MNIPNEKRYIEDSFDLEDYKKSTHRLNRKNAGLRKYKKISWRLSVLCVVLLISAAFSAIGIFNYYSEIKSAAFANEKARELANTPLPASAETGELKKENAASPVSGEEIPPVFEEPKAILEKITKLREMFSNDGIVGYLKIDNTKVDYAVVQSADNDFYLTHDLYGKKSVAGSVFMDSECDAYNLGRHTAIYAHNMRDGLMFSDLGNYADPDYLADRRFISLTTPYEETTWEIFSFYQTNTDFYYIQVIFPDNASFWALVSEMKERSLYDTGVDVHPSDKILTLSTCTNTTDDARFVLNARLVRN